MLMHTDNRCHATHVLCMSPLQQMTGSDEVEAGIKPSMFGGTIRRKKPPVARPPQEKKTEQELAGADVRILYNSQL